MLRPERLLDLFHGFAYAVLAEFTFAETEDDVGIRFHGFREKLLDSLYPR